MSNQHVKAWFDPNEGPGLIIGGKAEDALIDRMAKNRRDLEDLHRYASRLLPSELDREFPPAARKEFVGNLQHAKDRLKRILAEAVGEPYTSIEPELKLVTKGIQVKRVKHSAGPDFSCTLGEFAWHVANPGFNPKFADYVKAATGMSESIDSEGGVAVSPTITQEVFRQIVSYDQLPVSRMTRRVTPTNPYGRPRVAETARTVGNRLGGLEAQVLLEGDHATALTNPLLGDVDTYLHKLECYIPCTSELVEDAPSLDLFLSDVVAEAFAVKISDFALNGHVGKVNTPGLFQHPALVQAAIDANQKIATPLTKTNIDSMIARLDPRSYPNACFYLHPDLMATISGLGSDTVMYRAPGMVGGPTLTLGGFPAYPCELLPAPAGGGIGDILLADFSQVQLVTHVTGIDKQMSIHVLFDTYQSAFRFKLRFNVTPLVPLPITPRTGSNTISPYVVLGPRPTS